jgi:hypothetical protein
MLAAKVARPNSNANRLIFRRGDGFDGFEALAGWADDQNSLDVWLRAVVGETS